MPPENIKKKGACRAPFIKNNKISASIVKKEHSFPSVKKY
jgi:hypothetical protein